MMDLYKPICKHIVIPLWAAWEGTPYLKHMKYLEKSQYFPPEEMRDIQWKKIRNLLDHAYNHSVYYRKRFDREGLHPREIRNFDDFRSVPILTKSDVHESVQDMIIPGVDKYIPFLTSGSTGKPLRGYWNKECAEFKRAAGRRSELWAGYDMGDRIYCLYGNTEKELRGLRKFRAIFRRKVLRRTEILDMLQLSEESMLQFAYKMRKRPPVLLWGHAHGLYMLARFFEKKGINDIRPKGVYSAGMVLHDWERKKVEDVFHCKLQDRYGCEELGLIATECKAQQGLHINTDCHYVEILRKNGTPSAPGEPGQIIVTDLLNTVMPFIRYRLEDICVPTDKQCSCGRTQPMISSIEGRVADFLVTPEGKLVSGISLTDHFAGHIPGVRQIQIVQEKTDLLTLRIVKDVTYGEESERSIAHLVEDFFGDKMRYEYEFLDNIPQSETGKYRFTICKVDHGLI